MIKDASTTDEADQFAGRPQIGTGGFSQPCIRQAPHPVGWRARRSVSFTARNQLPYFAALAIALWCTTVCIGLSGLRAIGFTAVSSTATVPGTSESKVAPEGTR